MNSRKHPLVSTIVIVRNAEKTIGRCLKSLLAQTVPCEMIVVDGSSRDRTREIIKDFPVRLLISPPIHTYGMSRNIGVKNAGGEVVLFLDADDVVPPTWAETLIGYFKDPQVGIVVSRKQAPPSDNWFMSTQQRRWIHQDHVKDTAREERWPKVRMSGSGFRRSAIISAGGFDENMFFGGEDRELACRIAAKGYRIMYAPDITVRIKPTSGLREYLKDKFFRAGLANGYIRRKHGRYRPPLTGGLSCALPFLYAFAYVHSAFISISIIVIMALLSKFMLQSVRICNHAHRLYLVPVMLGIGWLQSVLEFISFTIAYVLPTRWLLAIRNRIRTLGQA